MGTVQVEGSYETAQNISDNGGASIAHAFVLDLGSVNAQEAMRKAMRLLQERGWHLIETDPTGASMSSAKWGTYLSVDPFEPKALQDTPDVLNTLQGKSVHAEALLIVDMRWIGEPRK
ncbi:hypothetical protein [Nonomuraea sp. SBT364]|uniref:hypothetical protein n=1 Tax=Nonomuraea sp. SBT364 TaxID=1580530 RepID=UPI0012E0EFAE|nr:hypothetical protein [Nonomuraea sp. SBT364]